MGDEFTPGGEKEAFPLAPSKTVRRQARDTVKRMKEDAAANYTPEEISSVISIGVEDLHNSVLPMTIISLLYGLTVLVQIIALPLIPLAVDQWFKNFASYTIFLPPAIGVLVFGYMIYAYLHNLKRWAYTFHTLVVGIWTILMSILWVWIWIEFFWYCPTNTPLHCTNGITSELALGYEIYAIVTLIQVPLLWIELFIYGRATRYWKVLYRATSFTGTQLARLIYMDPAFSDRYAITIGQEKRQ